MQHTGVGALVFPAGHDHLGVGRVDLGHLVQWRRAGVPEVRRCVDVPREDEVVSRQRAAVVPGEVRTEHIRRLHPAIAKELPARGIELREIGGEIGMADALLILDGETSADAADPMDRDSDIYRVEVRNTSRRTGYPRTLDQLIMVRIHVPQPVRGEVMTPLLLSYPVTRLRPSSN